MRKFNINVNGNSYVVEVEELTDGEVVVSAPIAQATPVAPVVAAPTPVAKPVAPAPAPKAVSAGGEAVNAPMPGTVLKLAVADGATVKKGDKILVLEAMKMENDINAVVDGVVSFAVRSGDSVETGAVLAYIK